ncbi:transposase [Clostridium tagluense]|uniref:transposase n=1 Tax=Clostridium tagluense TaxID=360422 RepID=UPI001CF20DB1|nr:transposase [Clostridium tagluense]MCB2319059.1 transposase [Clostridium tagluense]MCB2323927.1 transposase [Clostridium tagluense]MCB2328788.1 transposase [Clostridium tagluense]MCB2333683.1 transposase [Clostridium tagluense]
MLKSNSWIRQKKKISKIQNKISCQRLDWLHKISYRLSENYDVVVIVEILKRICSYQIEYINVNVAI